MATNVYIHVPFCKQKCNYCSFVSYPKLELKPEYLRALSSEIKNFYKNEQLNTLYFGGGTPSLLSVSEFDKLIKMFNVNSSTEITVELNPENLTKSYLAGLKDTGINRISIGCQTFNDKILKNIGRKHTGEKVIEAVKNAQSVGFTNISLDFIYGLPKQTLAIFNQDLNTAISLGIKHVSLYGLKIDKGCYFYKHCPSELPDEDMQANMYLSAIEILTNNNFGHYEISNFAIEGFSSNHNINYWNNNTYYGFGVAAHGYIENIRYSNELTLEKYIKKPLKHFNEKILSIQEQLEEEIFLGFRCKKGININKINKKYDIDFEKKYDKILSKYMKTGHILKYGNNYCLTKSGVLVSNYILSDFIEI